MKHLFLLIALLLLSCCGCKSIQTFCFGTKPATPIPIVFSSTPTLEQVKGEFNKRYTGIQSLSTSSAVFAASNVMIPLRSCSIAYEKQRKLRVRGGVTLGMGTEIDLGSNDEEFWFWVKQNVPKELYYAKHSEYANCDVRSIIPIEPEWLIETLGIIELKDSDVHEGPTRVDDGNLQITSYLKTPRGTYSRRITFHPQTGAILLYAIYAPNGQPFVGAVLSDHEVDPVNGILHAKKIVITCPDANVTLTINMGKVSFNSPGGFSPDAFVKPTYPDYPPIDLCSPEYRQRFGPGQTLSPTLPTTANYPSATPANQEQPEIVGTSANSTVYFRANR